MRRIQGEGGGAIGFWPDTRNGEGGGGGGYDRVSRSPGNSTVVKFMRAGINRQRKRAAMVIKCGRKVMNL